MNEQQVDNNIISKCETLVNDIVRNMPNPWMADQVNMKHKSKTLCFKNKWYKFTRR